MAALSVPHSLPSKIRAIQELSSRNSPRTTLRIAICCQNHEANDPGKSSTKKDEGNPPRSLRIPGSLEKLGKGLRDRLSPQRKGDWKDLTLMSLSFAVYVYISQKIVCAYCAWMYMPKQPW